MDEEQCSVTAMREVTGKVVPLLRTVEPPKVNERLVQGLKDMLEYAESGELQSFIGAGFNTDGSARFTTWSDYHGDTWAMLGSLEWLKAKHIGEHHVYK